MMICICRYPHKGIAMSEVPKNLGYESLTIVSSSVLQQVNPIISSVNVFFTNLRNED